MTARAEEMGEVEGDIGHCLWWIWASCVCSRLCPLPVHMGHRYCVGALPRQMIAHRLTQYDGP